MRLEMVQSWGDPFPFWMFQIPACLILAAAGLRGLQDRPTPGWMMGGFCAMMLGYLYLGRFSDPTYVASLISYMLLAMAVRPAQVTK